MFKNFRKTLIVSFIVSSFITSICPKVEAGEIILPVMPKPVERVYLSQAFNPALLKGIVIHPDNALKFDFLIDQGDGKLDPTQKNQEYNKLIKYFLAALTVPDRDQWVNLSPYEKNRIIADNFGKTEMGRDLLAQDYLLKQITSSLMYPESGLGKEFWNKVYEQAEKQFGGSTALTINTFNKVWIVPDEAVVYESGNTAYVAKSHLKVMLEEDYLATQKNQSSIHLSAKGGSASGEKVMLEEGYVSLQNNCRGDACHRPINGQTQGLPLRNTNKIGSQIIKELILPAIEKEVNEGKNFAMLRQVFSGMLLATWYKKSLKESLLGKIYADSKNNAYSH